ncbi:MAG: amino acid adenylation domain-containing protein [Clostridiales bacterium]|nr:amino acid adenylation domain-containing protein [Clostridiales bacterium]
MTRDYSYYPLTYPQQNIFKTETAYPGTTIGLITATMRIKDDELDIELADKAINLIIEHNDSLRARITMINREPRQYFTDYKYKKLEVVDLIGKPIQELYDFDLSQTKTPFQLMDNQLYKFVLLKINKNEFAVFLKIHHLISDGWSTVRIGNYILDYYEKLQNGIEIDFEKTPSYNEYIVTESQYLSGNLFQKDKEFWAKKFENINEPSIIKPRKSSLVRIDAKRRTFVLPKKLVSLLRQYCKETRTSIFAVIMSSFAIYLNRTTHKNNISIGTLVLNRSTRRQKNTVGMFISTVPICVEFESDMNFIEFNKALTREWMMVLKHQKYPFEYLLKDVREMHQGVKDLFDIVFSYQNASFTENTSSKEHTSRWHFNAAQRESLAVHIHDRDDIGSLLLDYDYLIDLFYEKEIDFLHDNFIRILWHALDNPQKSMNNLELISDLEKNRILYEFNSKTVDYDKSNTIVDILQNQAQKTPQKIALIQEQQQMTYEELNKNANIVAHELIKYSVKKDDIISVIIEKSVGMIAAIFGILKSGGAYLAIENDFPKDRKKYLLEDSKSKILITSKALLGETKFDGKVLIIEELLEDVKNNKNPNIEISPNDLAYVMYTSGTTGKPKGVMIEHKSVVNYVYGFQEEFQYTGDEVVLEQSSYSFDAFVEEVYPTLAVGATLVLANKYGAKDMNKLAESIANNNVTVVSVSPLVLNELNKMGSFDSIKTYISGGDVLKYEYMNHLIKKAKVYNTYGPTETTVCATYHQCDDIVKDNIPIGKPVANYKTYILDKNLNLLPIGVSGELYISGPGLARGYLNNPKLTKQFFIDNPYLPGEKMYKTNDIARWYPMGEIGYIGRVDRQVKIRGIRIELGEIESRLIKHPKIKSAVVIDREDEDKRFLCAYYTVKEPISIQDIREYLRKQLPSYMVPSYFLEMKKIPLAESGKVNSNALPELKNMILNEENDYVAPKSDVEKRLVNIVEKVLSLKKIGMNDNYFDLGGDSLSLTTLTYEIIDEFDVDVSLEKLFRANTLKEIVEAILTSAKVTEAESKDRNIVHMHKEADENKNIFFVHDGIGGIGAYLDLCDKFSGYNTWGIRAQSSNQITPKNLTIEEIASSYVMQILDVCNGPYNIAGWCIGGTIAFEIVRQLENKGKKINSLIIMDAIGPKVWENEKRFSIESEKLFISENLKYNKFVEKKHNYTSMGQLWEEVAWDIDHSILKDSIIDDFMTRVPEDIVNYMSGYGSSPIKEMFAFVNVIRTYHIARAFYFPIEKIRTDIHYIQATSNSVVKSPHIWEDYTNGKAHYTKVEGDHYTMLKLNKAKHIAEVIRELV